MACLPTSCTNGRPRAARLVEEEGGTGEAERSAAAVAAVAEGAEAADAATVAAADGDALECARSLPLLLPLLLDETLRDEEFECEYDGTGLTVCNASPSGAA